jgi:hypothetical protein
MKLLYKPFAIIAAIIAARLGQKTFKTLWARIDNGPAPAADVKDVPLGKVVGARALEAATMAGVAAAVDRGMLTWFHHLTGIWAGPKSQPPVVNNEQEPAAA